jgi:transposase
MAEENEMSNEKVTAIFTEAREAGLDKNKTIMKMVMEGDIDVTSAVREYQRLARETGLILGAKERTIQVDTMLDECDLTDANVRREMIIRIADKFDVSEATAAAHIRTYAEKKDIELPQAQRTSLEDMVQFVKEKLDEGMERSKVVEELQNEMGYTANSAASAYSRATRELGISTGRAGATVPIDVLVNVVRANKNAGRKQLTKVIHEQCGYAEATSGAFVTYLNFAQEYARQEVEAYKAGQA